MPQNQYQQLLLKTFYLLLICTALVLICYFYIDKPVIFFANQHHFEQYEIFKYFTYLSPILLYAAPIIIMLLIIKLAWQKFNYWQTTLLAISTNLLVTESIKNILKFTFARYWPVTWINNNPSLLKDGAYGFNWFHAGYAFRSFPSGHTTAIFAVMSILWLVFPKLRWLAVLCCCAVISGLIMLQQHFVGDIVAGAFLGSITGMYAVKLFH